MTRIDVEARISAEVGGNLSPATRTQVNVRSHWNDNGKVVIEINKERVTVVAQDIIDAVRRCSR